MVPIARRGDDAATCAEAAFEEIGLASGEPPARCLPSSADAVPITDVTAMLMAASQAALTPGADPAAEPGGPIDAGLLHGLAAIETAAGAPALAALGRARAILAARDAALTMPATVEPPPMTVETFQAHLAAVARELDELRAGADRRRAA
jgi:hypothetical protein